MRSTAVLLIAVLAVACRPPDRRITADRTGGSSDGGGQSGTGGQGGGGAGGGGGGSRGNACTATTLGTLASPWKNPVVQCAWTDAPIATTPIVIDLDGDQKPEIVFHQFVSHRSAVLRAIRGTDCTDVWQSDTPGIGGELAAGDLDGDGHPELIVGGETFLGVWSHDGTRLAITDAVRPSVGSAPAVADVDGDGKAEIIAFDRFGVSLLRLTGEADARTLAVVWAHKYSAYLELIGAVADVDLDGKPEVVLGNLILDAATGVDETPAELSRQLPGNPAIVQWDKDSPEPEIVVSSPYPYDGGRSVRVVNPRTGAVLFGPFDSSGPGVREGLNGGGPPTVADFDGDGEAEIGVAGLNEYRVFDRECVADPLPTRCKERGVLWASHSQDGSGVTGSSVFDFNCDGRAEVVYRDECFLRIYDGPTGNVLMAETLSSGTNTELPVVADADGDGHTEIVVTATPTVCTGSDPGTGVPVGGPRKGIYVYRDPEDRWASARRIWNQHTYHVTNIDEDGKVPMVEANSWDGHNSYRQNR